MTTMFPPPCPNTCHLQYDTNFGAIYNVVEKQQNHVLVKLSKNAIFNVYEFWQLMTVLTTHRLHTDFIEVVLDMHTFTVCMFHIMIDILC